MSGLLTSGLRFLIWAASRPTAPSRVVALAGRYAAPQRRAAAPQKALAAQLPRGSNRLHPTINPVLTANGLRNKRQPAPAAEPWKQLRTGYHGEQL